MVSLTSLLHYDVDYWIEIATPQALSSQTEKNKENFLEPGYPCLIVRELTPLVIREALEAFVVDREDAFWLKIVPFDSWNINDLNTIL